MLTIYTKTAKKWHAMSERLAFLVIICCPIKAPLLPQTHQYDSAVMLRGVSGGPLIRLSIIPRDAGLSDCTSDRCSFSSLDIATGRKYSKRTRLFCLLMCFCYCFLMCLYCCFWRLTPTECVPMNTFCSWGSSSHCNPSKYIHFPSKCIYFHGFLIRGNVLIL